jgi:6-methylsalicylate decarboxylase
MRRTSTPLRKSPLAERLRHTCLSPDCHPTRRQILACIGAAAARPTLPVTPLPAQTASSPRRIDVHHHCYPKPWFDRYSAQLLASDSQPAAIKAWSPQLNLEQMDQNGIATAICSLGNPSISTRDVQEGRTLARACNEVMARMAADHPDRFGGFAGIPFNDTEGSLKEIEYAFDVLKLDGVGQLTSYGDKWPGDASYAPIFEELNRRKAVVFFHPSAPNCCNRIMPGIPATAAEYPFDEVRCIMSLLFSGTFSKNSDVRFIFTHAGGPLPVLAERLDQQMRHPEIAARVPRGLHYELKKLYYEVANSTVSAPAMAALNALVPPTQMLFGSDWPYVEPEKTIGGLAERGYGADVVRAINRDNAAKLFPKFT